MEARNQLYAETALHPTHQGRARVTHWLGRGGPQNILNALVRKISFCPCRESNHSSSVFQRYKEIWWGNFRSSEHLKDCRGGRITIYRLFRMRCAKLQDIIMWAVLSKNCYTNIRPIMDYYAATSILLYMHGCDRKFYNMYVFSHSKNKTKVTCQITPQNKDIH
jgi:hypothetical protein